MADGGQDGDTVEIVPTMSGRVRFPGISPRAYEHPADRGAVAALRAAPGVSEILRGISGAFPERGERLMALASSVRVGPKQYPQVHELHEDCARILDIEPPTLFVQRSPDVNAMAIGIDQPFVVVTTALLEATDTESLRFTIGHELGHILSGHAVFRTLLIRLLNMQSVAAAIPGGALGIRAVIAALMEWFRKAELSADRAGLLCGQDPPAALRLHAYLAGATKMSDIDLPSFLQQAEEYMGTTDVRDSIHKLRTVETTTHPLAVVRAAQLQKWAASEDYRTILAGIYPRRGDDANGATFADDLKSAARSYRDSASETADPLIRMIATFGSTVGGAAGKLLRPGNSD